MVLCNRYIFLAHFGKIKKKSSERFFRKVSKTTKWRQICLWRQYFWPKTAKIWFLRVKKWFYVIDNFFWHILGKFKKIPRNGFFSKSQKPQNDVKFGKFGFFRGGYHLNKAKIKKSGRVTFLQFLTPNFITNFRKILGAVFEICH